MSCTFYTTLIHHSREVSNDTVYLVCPWVHVLKSSSVAQQTRPQHHTWLHHCFVIVVMISNITLTVVTGTSGCCKLHTSNSQNTTVTQTYHFHILLTKHLVLLNMFFKCFSCFIPFQKNTPGLRHQSNFLLGEKFANLCSAASGIHARFTSS